MKLFVAALLAAILSFAWGFLSHNVLTWHDKGRSDFKNEKAVAEVIKANATYGVGIYTLPYPRKAVSYAEPAEQKKLDEALQADRKSGPYVYAIVRPGSREEDMIMNLVWSFGRSFLGALLLGTLLHQTILAFPGRLAFCAAAGLFAGVVCILPQNIWFELPWRNVLIVVTDHIIEWTLAGLVLSFFLGREPTQQDLR